MILSLFFDKYPNPLPNFLEWFEPDEEHDEE